MNQPRIALLEGLLKQLDELDKSVADSDDPYDPGRDACFPRVHVGRVNSYRKLWDCHLAGVESVDGTGWMRGDKVQYKGLIRYLKESQNGNSPQNTPCISP